jgi:hypothetical protein
MGQDKLISEEIYKLSLRFDSPPSLPHIKDHLPGHLLPVPLGEGWLPATCCKVGVMDLKLMLRPKTYLLHLIT